MRGPAVCAALCVASWSVDARALGCCAGSPALTDRVGVGETVVASSSVTGSGVFARQAGGAFAGASGLDTSLAGSLTLAGRFSEAWSAWAQVPGLWFHREFGDSRSSGGGLGDLELGARVEDDALGPISFGARLTLPAGRAVPDSIAPLAVDVTGRGLVSLKAGAWFDQPGADGVFFTMAAWLGGGAPVVRSSSTFEATFDAALALGRELPGGHSVAFTLRESFAYSRGPFAAAVRHRTGLAVSGAWSVSRQLSLVASLFADVHAIEDSLQAGATLGVRFAP